MPTPVGHTLAGLAVFVLSANRRSLKNLWSRENFGWAALCVVASSIPDIDFIHWGSEGLTATAQYHHGLTHSIGFAFFIGVMTSLWAWIRNFKRVLKVFALTSASVWFHAVADVFGVDSYPVNGIGLPILWPISDKYFIFPVMPGVSRANPFEPESLFALSLEFVLYGMILFLAVWLRRVRTG